MTLLELAQNLDNTPTDDAEPIDLLRAAVPKLQIERDRNFALDLIEGFETYGRFTDKQAIWVTRLIDRANKGGAAPKPESIGDLAGLFTLFKRAEGVLQWPVIRLRGDGTMPNIKLSVAGPNAKQPGTINVADDKAFGTGNWYGRITREGIFEPGRDAAPPTLLPLLRALAANPRGVMRERGRGRLARVA
jgi:hypothetical protein